MYGNKFKRQLDVHRLHSKEIHRQFLKELLIEIAKRKSITKKILELPYELRKHIYIYTIKRFWREDYFPLVSKVPMSYSYSQYVIKETQKTIIDNIHFLHLEYNTLPENKKWIMGCQCEFCLEEEKKENKWEHYEKYINNSEYFLENISCTNIDLSLSKWNLRWIFFGYNIMTDSYNSYIRIFDPLCNRYISPEDNIRVVRNGLTDKPLFFSEEI